MTERNTTADSAARRRPLVHRILECVGIAALLGLFFGGWGAVAFGTGVVVCPLAAMALLARDAPGRHVGRKALAAAVGGPLLGGAVVLLRHPDETTVMALSLAASGLVGIPLFLVALEILRSGAAGTEDSPRARFTQLLLAVVIGLGTMPLATPLAMWVRERDVSAAKAWVEELAGVVEREAGAGGGPDAVADIRRRLPRAPWLVRREPSLDVAIEDGQWRFEFSRGSGFGVEGWVYRHPAGGWEHWVD